MTHPPALPGNHLHRSDRVRQERAAQQYIQNYWDRYEHLTAGPCCCRFGSAIKGEHPESECWMCPIHGGTTGLINERCKRHSRELLKTT